jgi:acetyl esterase/lipase
MSRRCPGPAPTQPRGSAARRRRGAGLLLPLLALLAPLVSAQPGSPTVAMPVSFADVTALEARGPDRRVAYGSEPSQHAYLWRPPGQQPAPVVVLVHGGCWLSEYAVDHVFALAARLARAGFAVWAPEYRRVGETGGGWPGSAADLVLALDRLANLREPRLNLHQVLLAGHSAGGHLALWLASRDPDLWPAGITPRGVVGIAAITDLAAYAAGDNSCQAVTPRFMGGSPQALPARYAQASPASLPLRLPTVLLRGDADRIVGAQQLAALRDRSGVATRTLAGAGHFDWIHPRTDAYALLQDTLANLLEQSLRAQSQESAHD